MCIHKCDLLVRAEGDDLDKKINIENSILGFWLFYVQQSRG